MGDTAVRTSQPHLDPLITGLLEHVTEMAVVFTGSRVTHVNRAFETTTGFRLAEIRGLHPRQLLGEADSHETAEALLAAAAGGQAWSAICGLATRAGREIPVRLALLPAGNRTCRCAVLLATSDAGREVLNHDRRLRAIGQFTGKISHSLNNHLTVIQAHVAAALGSGEALRQPELVELERATNRAAALVAELLLFSRRGNSRRVAVELEPLMRQLVAEIRSLVPETVAIRESISARSGTVETEAGCVEQIILNLATNARDALPDGGVLEISSAPLRLERATVFTTGVLEPGEYVTIAVRDHGVGMDNETQRQIFTPFFSTKPAGLGTGLGMPTVRDMVRNNRGQIQVDSSPGEGTSISVILPRTDGAS